MSASTAKATAARGAVRRCVAADGRPAAGRAAPTAGRFVGAIALVLGMVLGGAGCVTVAPQARTAALARVDPQAGYRFAAVRPPEQLGRVLLVASFSGGGVRAAAMAHGALEALRDTPLPGTPGVRLLDELDAVHGVSGGAIAGAHYVAHGPAHFERFVRDFLHADFERQLLLRAMRPDTLARLLDPTWGRGDVLAEQLDATLYGGLRYGDLARLADRPMLLVHAADLGTGARMTFEQGRFDWLCADLDAWPVARAVAASAALPPHFAPISIANRAGQCGAPAALPDPLPGAEAFAERLRRERAGYLDAARRPFVHLLDGGLVDNLGHGGVLAEVAADPGFAGAIARATSGRTPRHVVYLSVDAERPADLSADASPAVPARDRVSGALFDLPSRLVSESSRAQARAALDQAARDALAAWKAAGAPGRPPAFHWIELRLQDLADPQDRAFAAAVPTTLTLPPAVVDRLRSIARTAIAADPAMRRLLEALAADAR